MTHYIFTKGKITCYKYLGEFYENKKINVSSDIEGNLLFELISTQDIYIELKQSLFKVLPNYTQHKPTFSVIFSYIMDSKYYHMKERLQKLNTTFPLLMVFENNSYILIENAKIEFNLNSQISIQAINESMIYLYLSEEDPIKSTSKIELMDNVYIFYIQSKERFIEICKEYSKKFDDPLSNTIKKHMKCLPIDLYNGEGYYLINTFINTPKDFGVSAKKISKEKLKTLQYNINTFLGE